MNKNGFSTEILEDKKENSERWLLTYSDMITLLLALFIILYSISAVDAEKFKQVSSNMNAALHNPQNSETAAQGSGGTVVENSLEKIAADLNAYVRTNHLSGELEVTRTPDIVTIRIKDSALFYPDRDTLLPDSVPLVQRVAEVLTSVYAGIDHIAISGHTADIGEDSMEAWRLSADRAVAVLKVLVDSGMQQEKFSVEGSSHFKPVAPNTTESNKAKNRRVEIMVTKSAANGGLIELPNA